KALILLESTVAFDYTELSLLNTKLTCRGRGKGVMPRETRMRPGHVQRLDTYHGLRGTGGSLSQGLRDQGANLVSAWDFQEGRTFQPRCGLRPPPGPREFAMRFYNQQHRFYCGVDLHARTMYLCILDGTGQVVYDKNLSADPDAFLKAVAPFRDGLVV